MARDHGRILVSIWDDPDFILLPPGPQRLYIFLLTQADLSHAGAIALRLRRWATRCAGLTEHELHDALQVLADARFVVVDEDTEEVLVRTLMRNDGVWKQPNVMKAAVKDAREILSRRLRAALLEEVRRLPLDDLSSSPGKNGAPSTRAAVEASVETLLDDLRDEPEEHSTTLLGRVPETLSDTPPVRAHDTRVPPPPPPPPPSSASGGAVASDRPTAQTLLAEWLDHCEQRPPRRVRDHTAREIKTMLDEGIPVDDVRRGLAAWHAKRLHPSALASVVHETRLGPAAGAPSRASTTDQRVADALALRDELRDESAATRRTPAIGA